MPTRPPESSNPVLAAFVPLGETAPAAEIPIHSPNARIGQGAQNEIVLDDDTVSTQHARLTYEAGVWQLTDLNSKNGTYLDGTRLAPGVPTPLPADAELAFGALKLGFASRREADPENALATYTPPSEPAGLAQRAGFRVPVWLALLLLVAVALVLLVVWLGGDPQVAEPIIAPASRLLDRGRDQLAA